MLSVRIIATHYFNFATHDPLKNTHYHTHQLILNLISLSHYPLSNNPVSFFIFVILFYFFLQLF